MRTKSRVRKFGLLSIFEWPAILLLLMFMISMCSGDDDDDDDLDDDVTEDDDNNDDETDDDDDDDDDMADDDDDDDDNDDNDDTADDDDDDDTAECGDFIQPTDWPTSGYYVRFVIVGEFFLAWVDSTEGIATIDNWRAGTMLPTNLGIPGAPIELDSTFNPGYSYRLKPDEIIFGENWIEVCDATPCYVEQDPAAWFVNPSTWCPWGATVARVWDCEGGTGSGCTPIFPW